MRGGTFFHQIAIPQISKLRAALIQYTFKHLKVIIQMSQQLLNVWLPVGDTQNDHDIQSTMCGLANIRAGINFYELYYHTSVANLHTHLVVNI